MHFYNYDDSANNMSSKLLTRPRSYSWLNYGSC